MQETKHATFYIRNAILMNLININKKYPLLSLREREREIRRNILIEINEF